MQFDSAINAQAEILRDVFGFDAIAGGDGPSTYADPVRAEMVATPAVVFSETQAEIEDAVTPRSKPSARKAFQTERRVTDDIAVGIESQPNGESQLVAIYQRPGLRKEPIFGRLKDRYGDEISIKYGGRVRALIWQQQRQDPILLGSSTGHKDISAGTLGCFATDTATGRLGILSNNHVLADVNAGKIGDAILQQGKADGGGASDAIGSLQKYVPIKFGGAVNSLDVAWADLSGNRGTVKDELFDNSKSQFAKVAQATPVALNLLDTVHKVGRTTQYTRGQVTAVNIVNLQINMGGGLLARFDNVSQIETLGPSPFARPGDSGSLIMNDLFQPAALLFGGSASGGAGNLGLTYACDLNAAITALGISLAI